jgi:hypothetical protein
MNARQLRELTITSVAAQSGASGWVRAEIERAALRGWSNAVLKPAVPREREQLIEMLPELQAEGLKTTILPVVREPGERWDRVVVEW